MRFQEGCGTQIQVRFRQVPVQRLRSSSGRSLVQKLGQVPKGCSADSEVRLKVPVQRLGQVPEGSGAAAEVRFRKVPVQRLGHGS